MDFSYYSERFKAVALEKNYTLEDIDKCLIYAKKLNQQNIPIIYDQFHFARLVGYEYQYILAISNNSSIFYKKYVIPKRNGGQRIILEPYPSLKEIQSWILNNILVPASLRNVSPVAKAFMKRKSIRENARFHRNKSCVIALDLHDFFGTIRYGKVYKVFKSLNYSSPVCVLLANLCLYKGVLPQGAPTSPMISNLVFKRLDDKIFSYCRNREILYTRYADDLTFSSDRLLPERLIPYIKMLVSSNGFVLNESKTKVMRRGMSQQVTGVVVNEKIQVKRSYRDKIRQEIYYAIKYGISGHLKNVKNIPIWISTQEDYLQYLYGKINYVLQINPSDKTFLRYKQWIKENFCQ